MEHAELVAPGVAQDPEVKAALLLVVIAGRAQRLQALDLGLNIVGLQVEMQTWTVAEVRSFLASVRRGP